MRVWIARTQPGADRLAAHLSAVGFEPFVYPVIRVEQTETAPPAGNFDVAIVLSAHAAFALAALSPLGEPDLYAVGPATAAAMRAVTPRPATVPDVRSSEGLLDLPRFRDPAGLRVLLLCGDAGRQLLPRELTRRGAEVVSWPVYRRIWVTDVPQDDCWLHAEACVAGSGEGQAAMADLWFAAGGSRDLPLVVPSERIVDSAHARGWSRVVVSEGADDQAVGRALRGLQNGVLVRKGD